MKKFFRITAPDKKTFVVVARGWSGLIGLVDNLRDMNDWYVTDISLFEFIRYVIKKEVLK
jgi:hypothetical protein